MTRAVGSCSHPQINRLRFAKYLRPAAALKALSGRCGLPPFNDDRGKSYRTWLLGIGDSAPLAVILRTLWQSAIALVTGLTSFC